MKAFHLLFLVFFLSSCYSQQKPDSLILEQDKAKENPIMQYQEANPETKAHSQALGSVSKGSLVNGKLMPFSGKNFFYFDTTSYVEERAYVHEDVRTAVLNTYLSLEKSVPGRNFVLMECSKKHGGKLEPHITHQNGLSIDFMSPNKKGTAAYYGLDSLGLQHYFLEYNEQGCYDQDPSICIDFDVMALHLLTLEREARKQGLKISKVLLKIELKNALFSSKYGKELQASGIYFARQLPDFINKLHDDHYHVDFEFLKKQ